MCAVGSKVTGYESFALYLIVLVWYLVQWFENISFEALEGYHTTKVNLDYKLGFVLFLLSEIMFFFSIF